MYKFLTADRYGYWSKEFKYNLIESVQKYDYRLIDVLKISVSEVPKTKIKKTRIFFKRILGSIGLMYYPDEYAKQYTLKSNTDSSTIICRAMFSGDHLIAISFTLNSKNQKNEISKVITNEFRPYEIVWISNEN